MMLQNVTKKWLVKIGIIGLSCVLCSPIALTTGAAEEETEENDEYEGAKVDPFTGEVIRPSTGEEDDYESDGKVWLSRLCYYVPDESLYYFYSDSVTGEVASSNIENGAYVMDSVSITMHNSVGYKLYCNGEELVDQDMSSISEPGSYVMMLLTNSYGNEELLRFTIIGEYTSLGTINIPSTCTIQKYQIDGKEQSISDNSLALTEEGAYEISYANIYTHQYTTIKTTVDRTAPELKLAELNEQMRANRSVDISDLEEGADITILLDGKEIKYSPILQQHGVYNITVTDRAGNRSVYRFIILVHLNNQGIIFISIVCALSIGVAAYLIIGRARMKVR